MSFVSIADKCNFVDPYWQICPLFKINKYMKDNYRKVLEKTNYLVQIIIIAFKTCSFESDFIVSMNSS